MLGVLILINIGKVAGQADNKKVGLEIEANVYWSRRPQFSHSESKKWLSSAKDAPNSLEVEKLNMGIGLFNYRLKQQFYHKYRIWGIDFWAKFPNDKRRFEWLMETIKQHLIYFKNMDAVSPEKCSGDYIFPLDIPAKQKWKQQYQLFRAEFLGSKEVDKYDKINLLRIECAADPMIVYRQACHAFREQNNFDLIKWTKMVLDFADDYYKLYSQISGQVKDENGNIINDPITDAANAFFLYSSDFGLNYVDLQLLAKAFARSKFPNLISYGNTKLSLLTLQREPFDFQFNAVNGDSVDLKKMRGKLILLDFWATSCTSCIAKMPEVKSVFEKYQSKGFEVISICVNPEIDRDRVIAIHNRIGASWPLLLIGGKSERSGHMADNSLAKQIWNRYGFSYVPQLVLVDQKGLLCEYNGPLFNKGMLEQVVKKHLNN